MPTIEQLEKLLSLDAEDTFVLYGLAQEHAKAGSHAEAIAYYDRCLGVDADYLYAYYHKAVAQIAAGDAGGAKETLGTGLDRSRAAGDAKAQGEISELLAQVESGGV
ncbi:MAG: tetratricopeptide repeat protein [Planctomycetota bacterium]